MSDGVILKVRITISGEKRDLTCIGRVNYRMYTLMKKYKKRQFIFQCPAAYYEYISLNDCGTNNGMGFPCLCCDNGEFTIDEVTRVTNKVKTINDGLLDEIKEMVSATSYEYRKRAKVKLLEKEEKIRNWIRKKCPKVIETPPTTDTEFSGRDDISSEEEDVGAVTSGEDNDKYVKPAKTKQDSNDEDIDLESWDRKFIMDKKKTYSMYHDNDDECWDDHIGGDEDDASDNNVESDDDSTDNSDCEYRPSIRDDENL